MNTEQTIKLIVLCTCEIIKTDVYEREKQNMGYFCHYYSCIALIGYWILSSPRIEKDVNQQSKEVIEDLTID